MEFIDDNRLLVSLWKLESDLPCVVLVGAEKDIGGDPAQMSFQFSPNFSFLEYPSLLLECGAHKPPPVEHLVPFYQNSPQRIAVLAIPGRLCYLVVLVEALMKLAEGREGCEIGWDEWKEHLVIPSIHQPDLVNIRVSGCRLFCVTSQGHSPVVSVEVYDFSKKGRAEYLGERAHPDPGGVKYLSSTGVYLKLPCETLELIDTDGGCDSVIFFAVSVLHLSLATRLNDTLYVRPICISPRRMRKVSCIYAHFNDPVNFISAVTIGPPWILSTK